MSNILLPPTITLPVIRNKKLPAPVQVLSFFSTEVTGFPFIDPNALAPEKADNMFNVDVYAITTCEVVIKRVRSVRLVDQIWLNGQTL